ncbi:hypothetical protein ABK040_014864 [Willaertia magna]
MSEKIRTPEEVNYWRSFDISIWYPHLKYLQLESITFSSFFIPLTFKQVCKLYKFMVDKQRMKEFKRRLKLKRDNYFELSDLFLDSMDVINYLLKEIEIIFTKNVTKNDTNVVNSYFVRCNGNSPKDSVENYNWSKKQKELINNFINDKNRVNLITNYLNLYNKYCKYQPTTTLQNGILQNSLQIKNELYNLQNELFKIIRKEITELMKITKENIFDSIISILLSKRNKRHFEWIVTTYYYHYQYYPYNYNNNEQTQQQLQQQTKQDEVKNNEMNKQENEQLNDELNNNEQQNEQLDKVDNKINEKENLLQNNEINLLQNNYEDSIVTYIVLREWFDKINIKYEFRCLVYNNQLVGISQYDQYIYYNDLFNDKEKYLKIIKQFFKQFIQKTFHSIYNSYIFDVFIDLKTNDIKLIELNPYDYHTSVCMFDWEKDVNIIYYNLQNCKEENNLQNNLQNNSEITTKMVDIPEIRIVDKELQKQDLLVPYFELLENIIITEKKNNLIFKTTIFGIGFISITAIGFTLYNFYKK